MEDVLGVPVRSSSLSSSTDSSEFSSSSSSSGSSVGNKIKTKHHLSIRLDESWLLMC